VLVRGERGEIVNHTIHTLKDFRTPLRLEFLRHQAGVGQNTEGRHFKGIQLGHEWLYTNPLAPACTSDDDISLGTSLMRMARYVATGESHYPLADGCQDHYLGLKCSEAIAKGVEVRTETMPWAAKPAR
jgi:hypothetical protein